MSGGQRMDDHSFWAGARSKASVFPDGPHKEKEYSSTEGSGELSQYQDTTEAIKKSQEMGVSQSKKHPLKTGTRN